jgi:hypothetical protein
MSPEDLHTLELMRFTVADISRFYGVPLHLLNETDKSTSWGSGIAEQSLGFLIYSVEHDSRASRPSLITSCFPAPIITSSSIATPLMAMDPLKAAEVASSEIAFGGLLPNEYSRAEEPATDRQRRRANDERANVPLKKIMDPDAQPRMDPIQSDALPPRDPLGANSGGPPVNDNNSSDENAA